MNIRQRETDRSRVQRVPQRNDALLRSLVQHQDGRDAHIGEVHKSPWLSGSVLGGSGSIPIQRKLVVGLEDDPAEREADTVAQHVMQNKRHDRLDAVIYSPGSSISWGPISDEMIVTRRSPQVRRKTENPQSGKRLMPATQELATHYYSALPKDLQSEDQMTTLIGLLSNMSAMIPDIGPAIEAAAVALGLLGNKVELVDQIARKDYSSVIISLLKIGLSYAKVLELLQTGAKIAASGSLTFLAEASAPVALMLDVAKAVFEIPQNQSKALSGMYFVAEASGVLTSWIFADPAISPHRVLLQSARTAGYHGSDISKSVHQGQRAANDVWQKLYAKQPGRVEAIKREHKNKYVTMWNAFAKILEGQLGLEEMYATSFVQSLINKKESDRRSKEADLRHKRQFGGAPEEMTLQGGTTVVMPKLRANKDVSYRDEMARKGKDKHTFDIVRAQTDSDENTASRGLRKEPIDADVYRAIRSEASSLDRPTLTFMESQFGHSFRNVRIHANEIAAQSAELLNARAYTYQSDIVFGKGEYAPSTTEGQSLIAHELAHVVQQSRSM